MTVPMRANLRAADADREAIVERLATALSEGRLGLEEHRDRLDQAYAARTYADLDRLVADLPTRRAVVEPAQRPSRRCRCW